MYRLTPEVMHFAWGSHETIAALTRRPAPTAEPEAELWMGAHEHAPSGVLVDGERTTLDRLVEDRPELLGPACVEAFEGRLPFLLKILAPQQPLSIQCHPDARQALDAPPGIYADRWPKPEAWLAVSTFEFFAGMRSFEQMRSLASALGAPGLGREVEAVRTADRPMHALLANLLHLEGDARIEVVRDVVAACRDHAGECGDDAAAVVARFADRYPDDIGLVVLLLMRHRIIEPGSYVFVPAGVMHTPISGAVVEILANSDNVVRAGLTPKAINIEELLRIVDVDRAMKPAEPTVEGGVRSYPTGASHFQLHSIPPSGDGPSSPADGADRSQARDARRVAVPRDGCPRILLALHGPVTLHRGAETLTLEPGESCFVGADEGMVEAEGPGELFVATTAVT